MIKPLNPSGRHTFYLNMRTGRDADHSPPSSAKVVNE
jgi:hypothetical protein